MKESRCTKLVYSTEYPYFIELNTYINDEVFQLALVNIFYPYINSQFQLYTFPLVNVCLNLKV